MEHRKAFFERVLASFDVFSNHHHFFSLPPIPNIFYYQDQQNILGITQWLLLLLLRWTSIYIWWLIHILFPYPKEGYFQREKVQPSCFLQVWISNSQGRLRLLETKILVNISSIFIFFLTVIFHCREPKLPIKSWVVWNREFWSFIQFSRFIHQINFMVLFTITTDFKNEFFSAFYSSHPIKYLFQHIVKLYC